MYIIVNNTTKNVLFSDLKSVPPLKGGKAIDLDKLLSREEIERSKDLQSAIKSKIIKVIVKDKDKAKEEPVEVKTEFSEEALKRIQEEVARQLKEHLANIPTDNKEVLNAIKDLGEKINSVPVQNEDKSEKNDINIEDDEKIADIHTRSMNRLLKSKDETSKLKTDKIRKKIDKTDLDDLAKLI